MFRRFLFLGLLWLHFTVAHALVLDERGNPSEQLLGIFQALNIPLPEHPTATDLNTIAQERFLRVGERASEEARTLYQKRLGDLSEEQRKTLFQQVDALGVLKAVFPPSDVAPDYILVHGSTAPNLRIRLAFVAQMFRENKILMQSDRKPKLIFCLGDRNLFDAEGESVLLDPSPFALRPGWQRPQTLPTNESGLGEFIWNQADLPDVLRNLPVFFIKAPKKPGAVRAQTEDTVRAFLAEESQNFPKNPVLFVVSSNPFVNYQTLCTKLIFGKQGYQDAIFKGMGPATPYVQSPSVQALGTLLDNLARTLYVEVQLLNLAKNKSGNS